LMKSTEESVVMAVRVRSIHSEEPTAEDVAAATPRTGGIRRQTARIDAQAAATAKAHPRKSGDGHTTAETAAYTPGPARHGKVG
jgi:hypothetical protein